MPIDLKSMLCRVTGEVFGRGFIVVEDASRENPPQYSVLVRNCGTGLAAVIWIDPIHLDVDFPDHDVRTGIVDDDDNEAGKEAELHRLCRMVRVYLAGNTLLEHRCRLFRSGTTPVVHVEADGQRWQIGRSVSRVPNP
ncbi:hypothetical protein DFO58_2256 [Arthrobacter sp. AG1021]|uniref:hypothetical protein n=1 Tax=Arthrobacter sp. AG1021 TaxID=2183908 RepID=UPI000EB0B511|nr:hypothetical protein [Arthrobacter sp. AG1021]RKS19749.1 hypothetical protein DFO58_2256 [Arthrobacter sp. AG1021]